MFIYYNYYFFYQLLYILTNINIYYIYIQRGTNSMANFAKKIFVFFYVFWSNTPLLILI